MTLEEAIEQLVTLGEADPLVIARKVLERNDKHWIAKELSALAEDIIAERARQRLGALRRSAEVALVAGESRSRADLEIAKFWVPGEGWKKAAELTSGDLRKRASWYQAFAHAANRRAAWCAQVADLMDAEGVAKLGKLKAELPALPGDEPLALEAA